MAFASLRSESAQLLAFGLSAASLIVSYGLVFCIAKYGGEGSKLSLNLTAALFFMTALFAALTTSVDSAYLLGAIGQASAVICAFIVIAKGVKFE